MSAGIGPNGAALLHERAEILGIAPDGAVSAGGTCRLLRSGDGGWVAVNLARRDDVELLAAWMGHEWSGAPWDAVAEALTWMTADAAVERAQLLGIPAAVARRASPADPAVVTDGAPARDSELVVDLSALWAGPVCARILGERGMRVVKVEDPNRPDGARAGPPEFWARLNGRKESVTFDFRDERPQLLRLLDAAAVVVTSARARALEHLGLDLPARVERDGLTWVSITGYGLVGPRRDWVAFGDDAAVAGGLAVEAGGRDRPVFVLDAPADPLAGLEGAARVAGTLTRGTGAVIDVSMCNTIAGALSRLRSPFVSQGE